ncbi:Purine permease 3 [Linum perenne]
MNHQPNPRKPEPKTKPKPKPTLSFKTLILLFNCLILTVGQVAGPLLSRMYFIHGGNKRWLSAFTVTAGFPILIIPISISYYNTAAAATGDGGGRSFFLPSRLLIYSILLGLLLGLNSYLYSFGTAYLPVSVNSLVSSTQLAFTAVFALIIVRQKFSHYSINAVVLMTCGSVILGFHMDKDVPEGEAMGKYVLGFFLTIGAACIHGLFMTLLEYTQAKSGVAFTFDVFMQVQFVVSMFATLFCTLPMIINKDFQTMPKEAAEFGLGETKYYLIITLAAISMQLMIIGSLGTVMSSSSLFAGIITSLLVPVQQVFAVITLREGFNAEKGMALALCLWGFTSHLYGGYKKSKEATKSSIEEDHDSHDV